MGSFFYFSGLPEVLTELSLSALDVKLVLIGGGEQDAELRSLVTKLELQAKVIFTGMVSFDQLPDFIAAADVAINPMQVDLVSDLALPNKVIQYMASGVAVVTTRLNGLLSTFGQESGITWAGNPREVAIKAFQLSLESDRSSLVEAQNLVIASFSGAKNIDIFEEFLETRRSQK
jgi:glycosyltransferase involved in cell wall biosynthesis